MSSLFSDIGLSWLYYTLAAVYAITVVSVIIVVLSENRSPVKTLAWVTVLLLLPAFGLVLYAFFGRSIKNTRMISRRNLRRLRQREKPHKRVKTDRLKLSPDSKRLIRLTSTLGGSACYTESHAKIYTHGSDKINDLIRDLASAEKYINIQYYIIENDQTGRRLKDVLIDRARAGVKVRLIYDNVGSFHAGSSFFKQMRREGIDAHPFFKVMFPPFGTRINWRNHRKICIIDGRVGYIGGMNVAQRYIDGGKKFASWRDTHIRVTGPAVGALNYAFTVDWNFMRREFIEDEPPETTLPGVAGDHTMQLLTSGPTSQMANIALLFVKAIASAKERVYVQTPYFLPTEALLRALQSAALAGCDVRVMIPRRSDSYMLTLASASYITECLRSGIKIFMYEAGMLHAKTLVVDDEFVSIGSTNFDFRSFEHNFEANMQIYSRQVATQMREIFNADLERCTRINLVQWRKRSLLRKVLESLTRLLSPIL